MTLVGVIKPVIALVNLAADFFLVQATYLKPLSVNASEAS
jgi:hypothetical protein